MRKIILATVVGASAMALSSMTASTSIVCTGPVCWHTHDTYDYPPEARVTVHEDGEQVRALGSASTKGAAIGEATAGPPGNQPAFFPEAIPTSGLFPAVLTRSGQSVARDILHQSLLISDQDSAYHQTQELFQRAPSY
jgi:hypothetical protein